MSPLSAHGCCAPGPSLGRASDLLGHLGPGADLPRASTPLSEIGAQTPLPPPFHSWDCVYSRRCIDAGPPPQVVPCGFRPSSLLLLPPSLFSGEGSSPCGEGLGGAVRGGVLTPGHPFSGISARRGPCGNRTWNLGLWSSQRPGAIVCGRADRYGAPLGSNITSKVALATEVAAAARARQGCHRAAFGLFRMGSPAVGGAGLAYGGGCPPPTPPHCGLTLGLGSLETATEGLEGGWV